MADIIEFTSKKEIKQIRNRLYQIEKSLIDFIGDTIEITDIKKRLYQIENCLLKLTPVIDIAYEYEARVLHLEKEMKTMSDERILEGEELQHTRLELCKYAFNLYLQFMETIKRIPHDADLMKNAIQYFSDASLWMKEAILSAHIKVVHEPKPKEQQDGQGNEEESKDAKTKETKDAKESNASDS